MILKSYEEIDVLVDTDPLALREYAVAVSAEVARLSEPEPGQIRLPRGPAILYVESDGITCHHVDAGIGTLDLAPKERHLFAALLDYARVRIGGAS